MATIVNLLVGGPTANYPADLTTIQDHGSALTVARCVW